MDLRPTHVMLALSSYREGIKLIRSGQTDAGLRLIEHGADYLQQFIETPDIVRDAVARANATPRRPARSLCLIEALRRAALRAEVERLKPIALNSERQQRKYRAARRALREAGGREP